MCIILRMDEVMKYFKNQNELAKLLGVAPTAISNWKARQIPVHRAVQIELLTNGAIKREELRPDIFA
jgi:DNA-binding transcriptional regulator YdaS (Cro superfamily)